MRAGEHRKDSSGQCSAGKTHPGGPTRERPIRLADARFKSKGSAKPRDPPSRNGKKSLGMVSPAPGLFEGESSSRCGKVAPVLPVTDGSFWLLEMPSVEDSGA